MGCITETWRGCRDTLQRCTPGAKGKRWPSARNKPKTIKHRYKQLLENQNQFPPRTRAGRAAGCALALGTSIPQRGRRRRSPGQGRLWAARSPARLPAQTAAARRVPARANRNSADLPWHERARECAGCWLPNAGKL